jgi:hypothetical protein
MQLESLQKQIPLVGLEDDKELAHFLLTWCGATPANAYGRASAATKSAQPLDDDQEVVQSDMSGDIAPPATARSKRRAVMPGLPPRVAKWEQMQTGQPRGDKPAR